MCLISKVFLLAPCSLLPFLLSFFLANIFLASSCKCILAFALKICINVLFTATERQVLGHRHNHCDPAPLIRRSFQHALLKNPFSVAFLVTLTRPSSVRRASGLNKPCLHHHLSRGRTKAVQTERTRLQEDRDMLSTT